jgi:tRNA threonylcarbamoyladenosine biosynthesis protein TsaE
LRFRSSNPGETRAIARRLAAATLAIEETGRVGFVVALEGPLGAGKTQWAKGLAAGFDVAPDLVVSPTFVIANEYEGRRRLVHADLYRLESDAELEAAGLLDWLAPDTVLVVEWADRFPAALPSDRVRVRLARSAEAAEVRAIEIDATGPLARRVLDRMTADEATLATPTGDVRPRSEGEAPPWR